MNNAASSVAAQGGLVEIIAFRLQGQEFCVRTTTIREIRGWSPSTPIPNSPPDILGVMNLRGIVIPIIDLAHKLGMPSTQASERSAIVVAEVHNMIVGLVVERVSDILTVKENQIQPVPDITASLDKAFCEGIITQQDSMICFLNLSVLFQQKDIPSLAA